MAARVTNFGMTRQFPTCIGNVFMAAMQTQIIENDKAAAEIAKFPEVEIEFLQPTRPPKPTPAYEKYTINFLRGMARRKGIAGVFFMRKAEIIKRLKEQKNHGQ